MIYDKAVYLLSRYELQANVNALKAMLEKCETELDDRPLIETFYFAYADTSGTVLRFDTQDEAAKHCASMWRIPFEDAYYRTYKIYKNNEDIHAEQETDTCGESTEA